MANSDHYHCLGTNDTCFFLDSISIFLSQIFIRFQFDLWGTKKLHSISIRSLDNQKNIFSIFEWSKDFDSISIRSLGDQKNLDSIFEWSKDFDSISIYWWSKSFDSIFVRSKDRFESIILKRPKIESKLFDLDSNFWWSKNLDSISIFGWSKNLDLISILSLNNKKKSWFDLDLWVTKNFRFDLVIFRFDSILSPVPKLGSSIN